MPTTLKHRTYYRTAKTAVEKQAVEQLPTRSDVRLPSPEDAGRKAWQAIHSYRGNCTEWFATWETMLPHFGCSCVADYQAYKASNTPDFTSPESLWLWGVELHNYVNRKLGKPELTIEEARLQWSR